MYQGLRAQLAGGTHRAVDDSVEDATALAEVPLQDPVPPRRDCEPHLQLDLARGGGPGQSGAEIVVLLVEHREDGLVRVGAGVPRFGGGLDPAEDVLAVTAAQALLLARRVEQLAGVLADRLQHREARLPGRPAQGTDEAVVDERSQRLEDVEAVAAANRFRRLEGPAAREDREPCEEPALVVVRRPWLHSSVARSVRWRPGRSCAPPTSRSSARSRRRLIASGGRSFERAAASSIASGRPSSLAQTSATAEMLLSSSWKSGSTAPARAEKSRTASFAASCSKLVPAAVSGSASGGTGYSCSPASRRGVRLVARTTQARCGRQKPGDELDFRHQLLEVVEQRAPCSGREGAPTRPSSAPSAVSLAPSASARTDPSSAGTWTAARSTKTAPSRSSRPSSAATASPSRVLPAPPGPVSVTRRTSSRRRSATTAATSSRRPTSGVGGVGRRRRAGAGASGRRERGVVAQDPRARPPAAPGPGSMPSSSTSAAARPGRRRARPPAGRSGRGRARAARGSARGTAARAISRSSSGTSSSWRPSASSASSRSSSAAGAVPRAARRSARATGSPARSASGAPLQSASAASEILGRVRRPLRARALAARARRAARSARGRARPGSSCEPVAACRASRCARAPSARRSPCTYTCSDATRRPGGSSPQSASTSRSRETTASRSGAGARAARAASAPRAQAARRRRRPRPAQDAELVLADPLPSDASSGY